MLARAAPRARMATARPRSVASLGPVFRAVRRQPRAAQCFRLMHDDFAPKSKTVPDTSILDQIQGQVDQKEVVLYMKGVPAQPQCGFSNMVVKILEMEGEAASCDLCCGVLPRPVCAHRMRGVSSCFRGRLAQVSRTTPRTILWRTKS